MKLSKKTGSFIALLLLATTFNTHKTHTMEPISEEPTWQDYTAYIGDILLGDIELTTNESSRLIQLPLEMKSKIISLLLTYNRSHSLATCGKTINSLAQVNKNLNEFINNPVFCLKLIKHLALKFNRSDAQAATMLKTQEAKNRLSIQKKFSDMCLSDSNNTFDEQKFNLFYEQYKEYVDLNFTSSFIIYDLGGSVITGTPLMQAASSDNYSIIQILLNGGADITKTDVNGNTALIIAVNLSHIEAIECLLNNPHIIINQQNNSGYTALLIALFRGRKSIIKLLLDAGADPELANYEGLTPLQAAQQTGNQEVIDLIQDAIRNKHEKQGK